MSTTRTERVFSATDEDFVEIATGIFHYAFACADHETEGMATGLVKLASESHLPLHTHPHSEAITVVSGELTFVVEGREYLLRPRDCIHIPTSIVHEAFNRSTEAPCLAHCSFGQAAPERTLVDQKFKVIKRHLEPAQAADPEHVVRFDDAESYPLAENTYFYDLFNGTMGSQGICGGYGRFDQGTSLPCHVHDYDESISIIKGQATCEVSGRRYTLANCDTAVIPAGLPHRFINDSNKPMAMIWVYAGDMPTRQLVDASLCALGRPNE